MNRFLVHRIAIVVLFAVLVGRLFAVQFVDRNDETFSTAAVTKYMEVRPVRGEILAGDGKTLLAESMPIFTVSLRPSDLRRAVSAVREEDGEQAAIHMRNELFARLGQVLGITSTLTISPASLLQTSPALLSDLNQGVGRDAVQQARTIVEYPAIRLPFRGGQRVAVEQLAATYSDAVSVDAPEAGDEPLSVGGTLIITPSTSLRDNPQLRTAVGSALGAQAATTPPPAALSWVTLAVPPERTTTALLISERYTTTTTLVSPIAAKLQQAGGPEYQTIAIKRGVPHDVALVLRENAASMPGVTVEYDWQRRYPLSDDVPSLSHLLGYVGRINRCELVDENPAASWALGLIDSIGNAVVCRDFIAKEVAPDEFGRPRYLDDDRIGKEGVEASMERELRGSLGTDRVIVDVLGRPLRAPENIQPATDGANVLLTIDVPFQKQVETILKNWIAEGERRRLNVTGRDAWKKDSYQPIGSGAAVVMEVKTGRILAMVSWPAYDNNIWVDASRTQELIDILNPPAAAMTDTLRLTPLLNRTISGRYPAGSTLKPFDAAIALQKGIIASDTRLHDPGALVVKNQYTSETYRYPNAGNRAWGDITVSDALKVSSNVFFMSVMGGNKDNIVNLAPEQQTIDRPMSINEFAEGLGWFGLGKQTGVELTGEAAGNVPTPRWKVLAKNEQWTTGDTYNISIGQGNLLVTPLQLTMASAAIANGGTIYRPQLVRALADSSGEIVKEVAPEVAAQVPVDPNYYNVIREGLRRSVTEGANKAARDDCSGLQIAGKTGTAEFGRLIEVPAFDGKARAPEFQSHSWFVGFAPYDDPQIQVVVLSEGTGGLGDGSATIAVPAATQIMQAYFGTTPPNPLPASCQQNLPPLPPREDPANPITVARPAPADR